jgi:hypothetical protein
LVALAMIRGTRIVAGRSVRIGELRSAHIFPLAPAYERKGSLIPGCEQLCAHELLLAHGLVVSH